VCFCLTSTLGCPDGSRSICREEHLILVPLEEREKSLNLSGFRWKRHPEHLRLMVRRDPVETGGTYYRILREGTLANWDGISLSVKPNNEGLDLDRNFPANWRQEGEQYGAGPFPSSEPEVHNLVNFITSHPNITGGLTFHTQSGVLLRPYNSQPDDTFPPEDLWIYQAIGKRGVRAR